MLLRGTFPIIPKSPICTIIIKHIFELEMGFVGITDIWP